MHYWMKIILNWHNLVMKRIPIMKQPHILKEVLVMCKKKNDVPESAEKDNVTLTNISQSRKRKYYEESLQLTLKRRKIKQNNFLFNFNTSTFNYVMLRNITEKHILQYLQNNLVVLHNRLNF